MGNMTRIVLNGNSYPIKMDLNVLEHIQNKYGTIDAFELELLGLKFQKDKEGKQIYKPDGEPLMYLTEPSIRALKTALPLMINEGLAIEADEQNRSWKEVSDKEIFRECNIDFHWLAKIIHQEFKRCFEIKK